MMKKNGIEENKSLRITMEKHEHTGNNGFLLGVIAGASIALLFTTTKGRKILQMLTDEGLEKLNEWEDIMKEIEDEDSVPGNDYIVQSTVAPEPPMTQEPQVYQTSPSPEYAQTSNPSTTVHNKVKSTARRFFRGIPKRS